MSTQLNMLPQTDGNSDGGAAMPTPENVMPRHNNVPNITTHSISSSAMLVEFGVSQWMGRKKDKKASADVAMDNHAETGVASVSKKLLGTCVELDTVHKLTGNIRNIHYGMTMPWSDTGLRLLPTAQYFKYHQIMSAGGTEYWRLVAGFLGVFEWLKSQAQAKLGDLYNPAEYPTLAEIERKFAFNLSYIPLPDAGDFRVDVGNDALAQVKTDYEEYYGRQITNAMNDVWARLHDVLTRMSSQLSYKSDGKKEVFRDSLVGNVIDMVELLDVCNVTGDSQMAALKAKLSDAMYGVTADVLREDTFTRDDTKRTVDQIIASLPSLEV